MNLDIGGDAGYVFECVYECVAVFMDIPPLKPSGWRPAPAALPMATPMQGSKYILAKTD